MRTLSSAILLVLMLGSCGLKGPIYLPEDPLLCLGCTFPPVFNRLGFGLKDLSDNEKKQLEINNGLLVKEIRRGVASRSGMRPNDIILGINNQDVTTVRRFMQLLSKIKKGRNITLLIWRKKTTFSITMKEKYKVEGQKKPLDEEEYKIEGQKN